VICWEENEWANLASALPLEHQVKDAAALATLPQDEK
jgi:hypothetical protein